MDKSILYLYLVEVGCLLFICALLTFLFLTLKGFGASLLYVLKRGDDLRDESHKILAFRLESLRTMVRLSKLKLEAEFLDKIVVMLQSLIALRSTNQNLGTDSVWVVETGHDGDSRYSSPCISVLVVSGEDRTLILSIVLSLDTEKGEGTEVSLLPNEMSFTTPLESTELSVHHLDVMRKLVLNLMNLYEEDALLKQKD